MTLKSSHKTCIYHTCCVLPHVLPRAALYGNIKQRWGKSDRSLVQTDLQRIWIRGLQSTKATCTYQLNQWNMTQPLISWIKVLLRNLVSAQLVKKFPAFYGTWRFITIAHQLSLSSARRIESKPHFCFLKTHFTIFSHLCLCLTSGISLQVFQPNLRAHF
jgi:hypothetical protein